MKKKKSLEHLYEVQQLDQTDLNQIFSLAKKIEKNPRLYATKLKGKIVATLFYEPSTRTRLSFESAVKRLGGDCIGTESARLFSSVAKGETLRDSIRVVSGYADAIVIRSDRTGDAKLAAENATVPVINAGDGTGQHPSQSLLDLYTIVHHFGLPKSLTVALVGDLKNGRTVHSLAYLFAKHFPKNKFIFASPKEVRMPEDIKDYLNRKGVSWSETDNLDPIVTADVVYMTRVQEERFKDNPKLLNKVTQEAQLLKLTEKIVSGMKRKAIILHPLPRLSELPEEIDYDKRAAYFEQTRNGLFIRMALLVMMLNPD